MTTRNVRDLTAGVALTIFGAAFSAYAVANYGRGTLARVGEGAAPAAYGIALAFFGALIALNGFAKATSSERVNLRIPFFIILSAAGFAMTVKPFGLVPAIATTIVVSSLADLKVGLLGLAGLSLVLSLIVYAVFIFGLGLLIPLFAWP